MSLFNFHKDHKKLMLTAVTGFLTLSILIAVLPASQMQKVQPLPDQPVPTEMELEGLKHFIAEGCVACHTQQVRSIAMDEVWGSRPSMPSDYYYSKQRMDVWRQSPSLLGSERTGPDLTNIGLRQPGAAWHLLHLYNPRIVVSESIMPSYPWLFIEKDADKVTDEDVVVPVSKEFFNKENKKIVASQEMLELVAYLQSLKQAPLPGNAPKFIPAKAKKSTVSSSSGAGNEVAESSGLDGEKLYMSTCAACHQANGKGLAGAFPPLAGSPIVNDKDPDLMIRIILQGYDARSDYGQMAAFAGILSDEEIAAIASHERSSWGNDAPPLTAEDVKKIRDLVMQESTQ